MLTDLEEVADRYVRWRFPEGAAARRSISELRRLPLRLSPAYCRAVADHFDRAPVVPADARLRAAYRSLQEENLAQYQAILDAGLRVEPWLGEGAPYRNSRHLYERVRATGVLHVHLTRSGHGPARPRLPHPMREPAGITSGGVEFAHNDVFRAVHDVFGHVMHGNAFGPRGEFRATYCHLTMYPASVHPVLFAEQVGQFCWFYYGPHLADAAPGEPGHVPPSERPYPEQKLLVFPRAYLDGFLRAFG
ncbi:crotonobetainyl-CoA--carnitine CoA-transferase [Saccharopolyspora sp. CA-218241]|uniref:crotonobetainyl-CoA--carnitine CoA-transferase n=1 Tax=Saccharopolyspora sp. CA-218241 TaxID=3240027 RepID=UPI003D954D88